MFLLDDVDQSRCDQKLAKQSAKTVMPDEPSRLVLTSSCRFVLFTYSYRGLRPMLTDGTKFLLNFPGARAPPALPAGPWNEGFAAIALKYARLAGQSDPASVPDTRGRRDTGIPSRPSS